MEEEFENGPNKANDHQLAMHPEMVEHLIKKLPCQCADTTNRLGGQCKIYTASLT